MIVIDSREVFHLPSEFLLIYEYRSYIEKCELDVNSLGALAIKLQPSKKFCACQLES